MLNSVIIEGRLTAKPELRATSDKTPVTSFSVACQRNFSNANGEYDADFFDVVAWRKTAEFVCGHFDKGSRILIEGQLGSRKYTDKNGNNRVAVEITANRCHFGDSKKAEGNEATTPSTAAPAVPSDGFEPDFSFVDTDTNVTPFPAIEELV